MKHLLVPLDGSLLGESALCRAEEVLRGSGNITLVSAVETPEIPLYGFDLVGVTSAPSYQALLEEVLAHATAYLAKVADGLRAKGYAVDTVVQFGEPATLIVDTANARHVDAIVMSTHGRSGISRWLFGSVTSKVLTLSSCPVLVIPSEHRQLIPGFTDLSQLIVT